jgi:hypothetical protein
VTSEQTLAEAVRAWVNEKRRGDPAAAERAAAVAQTFYQEGASVGEACERAQAFIRSYARHPSQQSDHRDGRVRLAS